MHRASLMVLSAALMVTACAKVQDQYVEGVPDQPGLALEITGDSATEGISQSGLSDEAASEVNQALQDAVPAPANVPEYLQAARNGVKELNDALKGALDKIQSVTTQSQGKALTADTKQWGPSDVNGVTWRLFVKKFNETKYGFALQAKATAAQDSAYKIVMGGVLNKGATAHRGRGTVGVDLDNLKLADTTFKGQGKLFSAFSHTDAGKTLAYALSKFTPDTSAHEPVTAAFVGHKVKATGATAVRLAGFANLVSPTDGTSDKPEFTVLRNRHVPGVGGRGDALATGGNIPAGTFYYGVSCWNAQLEEGFKRLVRCTSRVLASCVEVSKTGDRTACAADLRDDSLPAADATDATLEPGAPDTSLSTVPATVDDGTQG